MRAKIAALCQIQASAAAARAEAANSAATGTTENPSLVSQDVDIEVENIMTVQETFSMMNGHFPLFRSQSARNLLVQLVVRPQVRPL